MRGVVKGKGVQIYVTEEDLTLGGEHKCNTNDVS